MQQRILFVVGALALAVITGVSGFFYGTSVGEARANQIRQTFFQERFGGAAASRDSSAMLPGMGQPASRSAVTGQVKSVNGNTIELSTRDSVIKVTVNDTTQITKLCAGTLDDVKTGERLVVQGDSDAGGTVTARSIQIAPDRGGSSQ